MSKNLVICCDGTNNSLGGVVTNIGHLSRLADIGNKARQIPYYDAGVGVEAEPSMRTRIGAALSRWSGSAFGTGLVENVEQAYLHLAENYEPGDRIFLFGFSRGAYTVRVIAGLMQNFGLLRRDQTHLATKVVKAYQDLYPRDGSGYRDGKPTREQQDRFDWARSTRTNSSVEALIHFMGLFDTVSSLGWAWEPKSFPNTRNMPNVTHLRHALAVDERRAKFRTNRVTVVPGNANHRQMWFAGVHSDIGGGYKAPKDALSRIPLRWMLGEAKGAGMHVNDGVAEKLDLERTYLQDEQAEQNESLSLLWRGLEYVPLPHWNKTETGWVESKRVYGCKGWREISDTFDAHDSLQRRKIPIKNVHWKAALSQIKFCS
jgi:uncharacterized protein (DUF2235 family)